MTGIKHFQLLFSAYAGDVRSTSQFSEIDSNDPLYESCRSDITNSSTRLEPEVSSRSSGGYSIYMYSPHD